MVVGLIELAATLFHWVSYLAHGRTEWLVVVQSYAHRLKEQKPAVPRRGVVAPDGTPYVVRAKPGWSGENPRYMRTARIRDHIYPPEVSGLVPGYVETLPDKPSAVARAAQITEDVRAGRWPWRPDGESDAE